MALLTCWVDELSPGDAVNERRFSELRCSVPCLSALGLGLREPWVLKINSILPAHSKEPAAGTDKSEGLTAALSSSWLLWLYPPNPLVLPPLSGPPTFPSHLAVADLTGFRDQQVGNLRWKLINFSLSCLQPGGWPEFCFPENRYYFMFYEYRENCKLKIAMWFNPKYTPGLSEEWKESSEWVYISPLTYWRMADVTAHLLFQVGNLEVCVSICFEVVCSICLSF